MCFEIRIRKKKKKTIIEELPVTIIVDCRCCCCVGCSKAVGVIIEVIIVSVASSPRIMISSTAIGSVPNLDIVSIISQLKVISDKMSLWFNYSVRIPREIWK